MSFSDASAFMDKLYDMMKFLIPLYAEEGKPTLTIAIGCTGGRHRSVTMANMLGDMLKDDGCDVSVNYRDIEKGKNQ